MEWIRVAVSPPRRVPHSQVPLRRCDAHGWVRHVAVNVPEPFPKPLKPFMVVPVVSGEIPSRGRAAPPHPRPIAGRWISGVRPRSGGLDLIRTDLISTVRCRSSSSAPLPSPAPLLMGPACQPCPRSLTPRAHLSALAVRPRAQLRDLISVVRSWSCGPDYPIPLRVAVLRKRSSGFRESTRRPEF
jgi:hypothetical protein